MSLYLKRAVTDPLDTQQSERIDTVTTDGKTEAMSSSGHDNKGKRFYV